MFAEEGIIKDFEALLSYLIATTLNFTPALYVPSLENNNCV